LLDSNDALQAAGKIPATFVTHCQYLQSVLSTDSFISAASRETHTEFSPEAAIMGKRDGVAWQKKT
jgi:hypothetical protein